MNAVPNCWPEVPLGECCEVVSGATPKRNRSEYWNGDISWVTPKDISNLEAAVLDDTPEYITRAGHQSCSARMLPVGSILFSSRAPIGLIAITGRAMCTNQGFKSLIPGDNVDSRYLYYTMKRYAPRLADLGNGATFKEVSKEIVSRFRIPLPPIEEQRRIAAILDKADVIRRKREKALTLADDFLRSAFLEMFGDLGTNPRGWDIVRLSEVVRDGDRVNYGVVQPGGNVPEGKAIVRVGDFDNGKINTTGLKRIAPNIEAQYQRSRLVGDEVLVSCVGSIGLIALANENLKGLNIVRAVARVPLSVIVAREYVATYLTTEIAQRYFHRETRTVSQPTLNISLILKTPVPLPPLDLQMRFKAVFDTVKADKKKCEDAHKAGILLFASLSQRAFRGEL